MDFRLNTCAEYFELRRKFARGNHPALGDDAGTNYVVEARTAIPMEVVEAIGKVRLPSSLVQVDRYAVNRMSGG